MSVACSCILFQRVTNQRMEDSIQYQQAAAPGQALLRILRTMGHWPTTAACSPIATSSIQSNLKALKLPTRFEHRAGALEWHSQYWVLWQPYAETECLRQWDQPLRRTFHWSLGRQSPWACRFVCLPVLLGFFLNCHGRVSFFALTKLTKFKNVTYIGKNFYLLKAYLKLKLIPISFSQALFLSGCGSFSQRITLRIPRFQRYDLVFSFLCDAL